MSVLGSAGSESTPLAGYLPCRPRVLPFLHVETPDVIVIDPTPVPRDQRTTLDYEAIDGAGATCGVLVVGLRALCGPFRAIPGRKPAQPAQVGMAAGPCRP